MDRWAACLHATIVSLRIAAREPGIVGVKNPPESRPGISARESSARIQPENPAVKSGRHIPMILDATAAFPDPIRIPGRIFGPNFSADAPTSHHGNQSHSSFSR